MLLTCYLVLNRFDFVLYQMLNRLWEVSSCVPAGVAHVKSLIDHARVKSNEGGPGNEAFLNMVADISLPETKRSSYFKVGSIGRESC